MNKFNLRALKSSDMFTMFRILKKIGFDKLKDVIDADALTGGNETALGANVIMGVVSIVLEHIDDCEQEVYKFLSDLSGMTTDAIANMPMVDFAKMIVEVFNKDEFEDFIKVASGLFNKDSKKEEKAV